jgi:hypothetical protein
MSFSLKSVAAAAALLSASMGASASITLTLQYDDGIALRQATCSAATATCVGDSVGSFTFIAGNVGAASASVAFKATNWYGWDFGGADFVNVSSASGNMPGAAEARLSLSNFSIHRVGAIGNGALNFSAVGNQYFMPADQEKSFVGSSSMTRFEGPDIGPGSSQFTRFFASGNPSVALPAFLLDQCAGVIGVNANDRSCSVAGNWTDPNPAGFSMRIQQQIVLATGESVQSQGSLTLRARVPEPMTLSLVGVALLGAAVAARRRSSKA